MTTNKKQNKEQNKEKRKTYRNEKKAYLKKNEVCLLFPNQKHTSNQTKIQKLKRNTYYYYIKYYKNQKILKMKMKIEKNKNMKQT